MKKKSIRRIISLALCLMVLVAYTPLSDWAGIMNGVAKAETGGPFNINGGETSYSTLKDAYNAAKNGDKIFMTSDGSIGGQFSCSKDITIDGLGHTLKDDVAGGYSIGIGSAIKFKNMKIKCTAQKDGSDGNFLHVGDKIGPITFERVDFYDYRNSKTGIVYLQSDSYIYFIDVDEYNCRADLYKNGGSSNKITKISRWRNCENDFIIASVGIEGYEDFRDAVLACPDGGTIVLRGDVAYDFNIDKKLTLDLNGWILQAQVINYSDGTIKDSTGNGMFPGTILNDSGHTLNVQGGQIRFINNKGTLNISGGSVEEGVVNESSGTLNITGGTFTKSSDDIITNSGTLNISGGTIAKGGARGIKSNGGTVTITGGSLTRVDICGGTANVSGGTYTTVNNCGAFYVCNATANITGGTFVGSGTNASAVTVDSNATVNISGGTFNYDERVVSLKDKGTLNISGSPTFTGRIVAASGGTLKIDSGTFTTSSSNQPINSAGATITINGGTFNGNNGATQAIYATSGTITINGGTFTRIDMAGKGTVNVKGGTLNNSVQGSCLYGAGGATLNVSGGTLQNTKATGITLNGATCKLSGGILKQTGMAIHVAGNSSLTISDKAVVCGSIRNDSSLSITGGYFRVKPDASWISGDNLIVYSTEGGNDTKYRVGTAKLRIDSDGYDTIADAINDANENNVIYLTSDIPDAATIASGKTVTINLNGHEMKGAITNSGTLTMQDLSTGNTGKVSAQIKNNSGATLNIQGGTYKNSTAISINNNGTATISGGTISRFDNYAGSKATITGGTFNAGDSGQSAVYVEKSGVVDIQDGTIDDIVRANIGGTFNISGGTFSGLIDIKDTSGKAKSTANISGGRFKGELKASDSSKIVLTGGFYATNKPDSSFLEEGYTIVNNAVDYAYKVEEAKVCKINNTYYGTLKKAVNAVKYGETITLLEDISANVTAKATFKIDLNGHTLTSNSGYPISVDAGTFTIYDSQSTGKVQKASDGTYAIVVVDGLCIIQNGIYDRVFCYGTDAELDITDGTFAEGIAYKDGTIEISGGWFKDKIPSSYIAEGYFSTGAFDTLSPAGSSAPYTVGYQVLLDMNFDGNTTYWSIVGPKTGFYASKPNDPYREDYDFKGWFSDQGCTTEFDFTKNVITQNTVIYAKWKKQDPWRDNCTAENCKHQVEVGNRHYNTFFDAVQNAASGSTLKLIKDCPTSVMIPSGMKFTVDLNGHTLTQADPNKAVISNYGELIITDTSDNHFGKITIPTTDKEVSTIENFYALTVENGNVVNSNSGAPTISNRGGALVINNGTITSVNGYAIFNGTCYYSATNKTYHGAVSVNGGSVIASSYCLWTVGQGKAAVNGGNLTSSNSHVIVSGYKDNATGTVYSGNVEINGGTLVADTANGEAQVINNYSGNVLVQANAKDSTYPRLKGAPAFTSSTQTHTTTVKGGWYSHVVPTDSSTTLVSAAGKTLYATPAMAAGPAGAQYTIGYKITTNENYTNGKTYYYYAPFNTGLLGGLYSPKKSDQIFVGWSRSANSTVGDFDPESPVSDSYNIYAIWSSGSQSSTTGTKIAVGGKYILTVKATNKGSIDVEQLGGEKVRVKITPNDGYQVGAFFLDGNYQASGYSAYTITMRSDCTINVEFISVYMTAEEYREYVERKQNGEGYSTEAYETETQKSGGTERYSPSKPDDKDNNGSSEYSGGTGDTGEDSYEDPDKKNKDKNKNNNGGGGSTVIRDKDGNEYNPGGEYEKIILSLDIDDDDEIGVDENGWYYIGEDIEQYFPNEDELEEITIKFNREEMTKEQLVMAAKDIVALYNLKAKSGYAVSPKGKKAIKIIFYDEKYKMDLLDGAEVFRSLKKSSGYGKKPKFTTKTLRYYNTAIKKGKKYYYKVRAYIKVDGKRYYTAWSTKACRKAKY